MSGLAACGLRLAFCATLLLPGVALSDPDPVPDPGAQRPSSASADEEARLRKELEAALRADQAAKPGQSASAAPAAATSDAPPPRATSPRGSQSLNPDLSAILDATAGLQTHAPAWISGDDPALPARSDGRSAGFTVQEVEVALSAVVDPYFKGEVYLTIPNLGGLEVEEAVATTTSLPWNLQARAGTFRSAFGRQNGQHLHVQDFTLRPLINGAFLGADGLRGPGAQLSWLLPLPFFLTLYLEGFSLSAPVDETFPSFGADRGGGLTGIAEAKAFFPLGEELSVSAGFSFALGRSPGVALTDLANAPFRAGGGGDTKLFGADLYVKWKPPNEAGGYHSVAWQTEAIFRHRNGTPGGAEADPHGIFLPDEWDGGLYSQLVIQLARRLFLGLRGDLLGLPASSAIARTLRGSASLTFQLSEFARLRVEGYADVFGDLSLPPGGLQLAPQVAQDQIDGRGILLQLEVSIGAHGAHAF